MNPDVRWKQRFQNFDHAFLLLRSALENGPGALNQLEKEGVVQRFEYSFELAWKTMKDFLEESGVVLALVTPRQVLKDAFSAKLIEDGQVWIEMQHQRNLLSYTYNMVNFEEAIGLISTRYLSAMESLHQFLKEEALK